MKALHNLAWIAVLALFFATVQSSFATDDKYVEAMKKAIDNVYKAQTIEEFQAAVNTFERIGAAEKNKWEPFYYAAFGNVMMALREKDSTRKDAWLDLATQAIAKATAIHQNESEIFAMEGFIHMIRVTVDPASRGAQYSSLAVQSYEKALQANPENPRALALLGQMQFGTAQFFKTSTADACATIDKAISKFDTFTPASPVAPRWGREMANSAKQKCQ